MTIPGPTEGSTFDARAKADEARLPKSASLPSGSNQKFLTNYYEALYPGGPPPTPEDLAMLNRSLCNMINTNMNEINARQATAQEYNSKVAKGEE
jgi:hypothetical protein